MNTQANIGHDNQGGGLQKHSLGLTYPYIVLGIGERTAVQAPDGSIPWRSTEAFDRPTRLLNWGAARVEAQRLAALHPANRVTQ